MCVCWGREGGGSFYSRDSMSNTDTAKGTNKNQCRGEEETFWCDSYTRTGHDGFNPNITSCGKLRFGLDNASSLSKIKFV